MTASTTPKPRGRPRSATLTKRYSREEIDHALLQLYLVGGNTWRVADQLGIPDRTLRDWLVRHADRYEELAQKHGPKLEQQVVRQLEQNVIHAGEATRQAIAKSLEQLEAGEAKDPAATARNLATVQGIAVDKMLTLTGRPAQITEHRDTAQIMRALKQTAPNLFIEGTAEDA